MMSEQSVRLRDVCVKIGSGATPRGGKEAYKGGATSLIRSQNIYNDGFSRDGLVYIDDDQARELRNVDVRPNDVLLNITGDSVARCCQVAADVLPARVNQHVAIIRPRPDALDAQFLRYILVSHEYQSRLLALASAGATRPALTKAMIEDLDIPAYPLAKQQAIANILGSLDDKIELNRRMNETLEGLARAIFQSWFVDFDPVRARRDGMAPPGLAPEIAALFPDSFEDSKLGKIPTGWGVQTIGDFCTKITDGSHSSPKSVERGRPMASVKDMTNWGINIASCRMISPGDFETVAANDCQPMLGDVLLAKDGATCLDTVCEYRQPHKIVLLSSVAILRPKLIGSSAYLHIWLGLDSTKSYLKEGFVSGSAIPRVVLRDLKRAQLVVPDAPLLSAFTKCVEPLRDQTRRNNDECISLAAIRDVLLPKLLSGEIRVANAERLVEDAT